MKDFLSIQEFSKHSGVTTSTLRYWDDIGLFSPQTRNSDNNYRYYTPDQIITVNFIKILSDLKVPIKKIADAVQARNPKLIMELIKQQEYKLQLDLREIQMRYSILYTRREMILYGMSVDETVVSVTEREEMKYILGPRNKYLSDSFYEAFSHFSQMADELRINLHFPVGGYHECIEGFLDRPGKPDYFYSVDPTGNHKRPTGDYLVCFTRGYYGELDDTVERISAYAKDNFFTLTGPVFVLYLHDEICTADPSNFLAQVCVAVSKTKR